MFIMYRSNILFLLKINKKTEGTTATLRDGQRPTRDLSLGSTIDGGECSGLNSSKCVQPTTLNSKH